MPKRKKKPESLPQQLAPAEPTPPPESGRQNSLTGIPPCVHWPLPDERGEIRNELEELEIQQFIDTAAEIAFAIARRKQANQQQNQITEKGQ